MDRIQEMQHKFENTTEKLTPNVRSDDETEDERGGGGGGGKEPVNPNGAAKQQIHHIYMSGFSVVRCQIRVKKRKQNV